MISSIRSAASRTFANGACGWCRREAFASDPLRSLRLARLACELDFEAEPDTAAAARASAPALAGVAAERIFAEIKRIVIADRRSTGWR